MTNMQRQKKNSENSPTYECDEGIKTVLLRGVALNKLKGHISAMC